MNKFKFKTLDLLHGIVFSIAMGGRALGYWGFMVALIIIVVYFLIFLLVWVLLGKNLDDLD